MTTTYTINRNGQALGEFSLEQTREMIRSGQALRTDLVWHEGLPDWKILGEMTDFAPLFPPTVPDLSVSSTALPGFNTSTEGAAKNEEFMKRQKKRSQTRTMIALPAIIIGALIAAFLADSFFTASAFPFIPKPFRIIALLVIAIWVVRSFSQGYRGGRGGGSCSSGGCSSCSGGSSCSSCGGGD